MSLTMFDDVSLSLVPKDAQAVAGYVNGRFANFTEVQRQFPKAHHLSISVFASGDAECLDVEPGDAKPEEAAAWVKRQQKRGVAKPVVYCSLSSARTVLADLANAGIPRSAIRLWTAHYNHVPHRCSPKCGFGLNTTADATQFTDRALGRSLDESLLADNFFDGKAKPAVNTSKLKAWRTRLRYAQGLLRNKSLPASVRAVLSGYARDLRGLIRKNK